MIVEAVKKAVTENASLSDVGDDMEKDARDLK